VGQNKTYGEKLKDYWDVKGADMIEGIYQGVSTYAVVKENDSKYCLRSLDALSLEFDGGVCKFSETAIPNTFRGT
jgi:hypothetical protein